MTALTIQHFPSALRPPRSSAWLLALLGVCGAGCDGDSGKGGGSGGSGASAGAGGGSASGGTSGTDPGGLDPDIGDTFEKTIGQEGGFLETGSGAFYLSVPPRALDSEVNVTVEVKDPSGYPLADELLGAVYEIGPDGTQFARDVMLSIFVNKKAPGQDVPTVAGLDEATNTWVPLDGAQAFFEAGTDNARATGRTSHFSTYTTWHDPYKLANEACRMPLNGGAKGIFEPGTISLSGATRTERGLGPQPGPFTGSGLAFEYWSIWTANTPTVTISGQAVIDGTGRYSEWHDNHDFSRPKPIPKGVPVSNKSWSFTADVATLTSNGFHAISVDDPCIGAYDIGFQCGPGCMGTAGAGGSAGAGAGGAGGTAGAGGSGPVNCIVGQSTLATTPRDVAVSGTNVFASHSSASDGIISLSALNPAAVTLQDTLPIASGFQAELEITGNQLLVGAGTNLMVVDITDPANLTTLGAYDVAADAAFHALLGMPVNASEIYGLDSSGTSAFIGTRNGGFAVVDFSNPASPSRVGMAATNSKGVTDLVIDGNFAFIASDENTICFPPPCPTPDLRGIVVFDVTTPAAPARVAELTTSVGARGLAKSGIHLYSVNGTASAGTLHVVSVATPTAPALVTSVPTARPAPYAAIVANGKLFVAENYAEGVLEVFSLANPAAPVSIEVVTVSAAGGAWGIGAGATHAFISSTTQITAIDLLCP